MEGILRGLGIGRRKTEGTPGPQPSIAPLARESSVAHHWLTLAVVRPGPAASIPVPNARVIVRPFPRGAARPEEAVARGSTSADGAFAVSLPAGRYAVYAQHEGEGRSVTVTLEHSGRALLVLESLGRRVTLTVEAGGMDGMPVPNALVEVRAVPSGVQAARAVADDDGVANIPLPPGAYEVHVGGAVTRTFLEADTILRLTASPQPMELPVAPPMSKYAQRARAATAVIAPLDAGSQRDEAWN